MSVANPVPLQASLSKESSAPDKTLTGTAAAGTSELRQALNSVQEKIAPVWPLKDYVAVNPYLGYSDKHFLTARRLLQSVSDFETMMPLDYYREQFAKRAILKSDIDAAVDELVSDQVAGAETIDVNQIVMLLQDDSVGRSAAESATTGEAKPARLIRTISEVLDRLNQSEWQGVIRDEISKHCSAHYDQGQALWPSPWKHLPLYQAWRCSAQHDRNFEMLGVSGFRSFVSTLPEQPEAAITLLLEKLEVPSQLWQDVLQCYALSTIGWSSWTRYKHRQAAAMGEENSDFAGLLAMRLAYEVALAAHAALKLDWGSILRCRRLLDAASNQESHESLLRYALLKASEIAYRRTLLGDLAKSTTSLPAASMACKDEPHGKSETRSLAQMVFCIDVRSERIRRHLEATSNQIETFGFAGFFGQPIAYVPLGESEAIDQLPVLLTPQFKVHEGLNPGQPGQTQQAIANRSLIRAVRQSWKEFQTSAVSCFGFVESTGLLYGWKLVTHSIGFGSGGLGSFSKSRFDGVTKASQKGLGPCLHGLEEQGVTQQKQADMAESVLRGIGIVDDFARLVVLCGHGSQTENNPLQAGLDCGACGGHSGEANARFAAKLLNQPHVRQALADRGISIGDDVRFVGALHNTTTDELQFFDVDSVPDSHQADLQQLATLAKQASQSNRHERLSVLPGGDESDLIRRSLDWSEVRPEWGLAGNAAFIAAPRALTEKVSLGGRSFLHSYDYRNDPEFKVLEQIMTAPMVVANWINMQYYASTVDPQHFGSGNKAIHNVVGRFGVLAGNAGDLMTGLPWQSIHDGEDLQHHPLRLMVVLAAPRDAIEKIVNKHDSVRQLLNNGWLQLVAFDDNTYYRLSEQQSWEPISVGSNEQTADQLSPSLCLSREA